LRAKRLGFPDTTVGTLADLLPEQVRQHRQDWGLRPVYKMVDTCAAEFEAATPYFYSTYEEENEAMPMAGRKAVVIGSGPIRIGQGIEFDYCSVHSAWALHETGVKSIMINSNPETVSTDFDTSDRLYFEPLDEESVRDVIENEGIESTPAIVQFGGQTAINLAQPLEHGGVSIIGSNAETIDLAEDRERFGDFLDHLGIPQPPGGAVTSVHDAIIVASRIGYPVLVRPSYVLGGRAMEIVHTEKELVGYVDAAAEVSVKRPILVDKYLEGKECEVDAIGDGTDVLIPGVMEHIERAGVHSGDSMAVYPGVTLTPRDVETIVDYTVRIARGLRVLGLMNVQYVIFQGEVYVLEVNPRASRTVPFLSKVTGVPMVSVATRIMLGETLASMGYRTGLWRKSPLVAIKAPVFSMSKLIGVDTYLGPEMKSTGEVMGIDREYIPALTKCLLACRQSLPPTGSILLTIADRDKDEVMPLARRLASLGYGICATRGTARAIEAMGVPVQMTIAKIEEGHPNVLDLIQQGMVHGVVNTVTGERSRLRDGFQVRRVATERGLPLYTSIDTFRAAVEALGGGGAEYSVRRLDEYLTPRHEAVAEAKVD
jgi:carbamoyl-phosphate synthase large subunit